MSAIETKQVWENIPRDNLDEKYEKCRNITEEIYKRIDITFQIKKLETGEQSDSDQSLIDSNELSNETDLFACDKSSISSSTEPEPEPAARAPALVNINNNNEEKKKAAAAVRRPRKRFRKRVKKRPVAERSDSDASSDSAAPLSRMLGDRPVVPNIVIITKDAKPRIKTPERKLWYTKDKERTTDKIDKDAIDKEKGGSLDLKTCTMCTLCFRGERGLRRHMNMVHITPAVRKRDSSPA